MTDFVFLISTQQLASFGLAVVAVIVFMIAAWIMVEWLIEMIENYGDGLDNWHISGDDHDRPHR